MTQNDPLQHYLDLLAENSLDQLTDEQREALCREYPYFSPDGMVDSLHAPAPDNDADFYPQEHASEMTTEKIIDTFLERYSTGDNEREAELLEKLILNPVAPDYMSQLEALPDNPDGGDTSSIPTISQDDLGANIAANEISTPPAEADKEEPSQNADVATTTSGADTDKALLSESLAKIYIKRGRYEKAFEIIHSLSLNYPEKSRYFADQLRFLHKAILIKESLKRNK